MTTELTSGLDGRIEMTDGQTAEWSNHRSGMEIQFGVSGALSGSEHVFMTRQKIPPGMASTPHYHVNCETAMYILQGRSRCATAPTWSIATTSKPVTSSTSRPEPSTRSATPPRTATPK